MLRAFGRLSLGLAVIVAAYIAWLLWGTGLYTARVQGDLRQDFSVRLEDPRTRPPGPDRPVAIAGDAVAILRIPAIDLDRVIVEGTNVAALKKGPGHYTETAYPWEATGRVGIAGHRTTYGAPFWSLDGLERGDRIRLITEFGVFVYRVQRVEEILPSDASVLRQTRDPTLVLTTCTPRFSAARRLVAHADLVVARPQ